MHKFISYLLLFIPAISSAEGVYWGAGAGQANNQIWNYSNFSERKEKSASYKLIAGYKFNNQYSFESSFSSLGHGKFTHVDGSTGDLALSAYNLAAKYNWNYSDGGISPYLKIGLARLKNQETLSDSSQADRKTSNNIYYAIGFEYRMDASSIYFEYEDFGRSGAFNRDEWSNQPAGVHAQNLTAGIRFSY